jgi:hypothetical protein
MCLKAWDGELFLTSRTYCCFCHFAVVFSQLLEQLHFSSQFVPIHSPLISSIVDFVCSSDQAAQELIFFHRLEFPTVWTERQVFPSLGWRLFFRSLWCVVTRVRKSGVILLLSIISISFGDHWRYFGRVFSIVVLVAIWTASISPTTSHRGFALRALSFALFSSILSLHQTRSSRFHFSFWSSSSRRRAPSMALLDAGRGEWLDTKFTPNGFAYV